jgi:hypothetical protein
MIVQRGGGDLDLVRDVRVAEAVEAACLDQLLGYIEDPACRIAAAVSRGFCHGLILTQKALERLDSLSTSRLTSARWQRYKHKGTMQETQHKSFSAPDETRDFPNGKAEILNVGDAEIGRLVFQPGWRWSNDVKPLAGTQSCEAPHFQYHVSGRLAIRMDDGTEFIAGPGDITSLPSGHDAWVVGDEPVVVVDWYGASNYARAP